ncbi:MAG: UDP-2,3-diacylglucosamine diphosphatase [Candidatus Eisenbacteria bacterium]
MDTPEPVLMNSETQEGTVYFIADSHLGDETEPAEQANAGELAALLGSLRGRAAHLYLVGDIFDFWFEYPYHTPAGHRPVLEALSSLSGSGTEVHFTGGNHDYWAGARLASLTGAAVHRAPIEATHFGRRLFIAHGDGLPRGDLGYRVLKSIIRNPLAIAGFSIIPPRVGAAIARWASGLSDVTEERIGRAVPPMLEFLDEKLGDGFDGVVVGHVHRQILREGPLGTGVIVGDWMAGRAVVALDAEGFHALRWKNGELRAADDPR